MNDISASYLPDLPVVIDRFGDLFIVFFNSYLNMLTLGVKAKLQIDLPDFLRKAFLSSIRNRKKQNIFIERSEVYNAPCSL